MRKSGLVPAFFILCLYLSLAAVSSAAWATSCSTLCANAGYSDSHCEGTAPFCNGQCYDGSGDSAVQPFWANGTGYIDCAGHCTDGNGCWTGHKECSCWTAIDCKAACEAIGISKFQCGVGFNPGTGGYEGTVTNIGTCGWSDTEGGVDSCFCLDDGAGGGITSDPSTPTDPIDPIDPGGD